MKTVKRLFFSFVFMITLLLLSGCSIFIIKDETFTNEGLSITLTNRFEEVQMEGFTSCYQSDIVAVVVIKEEFSLLESVGITKDFSIKQYLNKIININKQNATVKEEDVVYYDYTALENEQTFKYVVTAVKGSEAFYLVQFCVLDDNYSMCEDDIFEYAKSIVAE